jgi:diaminopimelate decarboxylase
MFMLRRSLSKQRWTALGAVVASCGIVGASTVSSAAACNSSPPEQSRFLNMAVASEIRATYGTPVYVYHENTLRDQIECARNFPHAYGLQVRFAIKAFPNAVALKIMNNGGIHFDASSGYEVLRAMKAGVKSEQISLSSQELPHNFVELIQMGIEFNACSIHQLEEFGKHFRGRTCGVRFNPGTGSGGTGKTVSSGSLCLSVSELLRCFISVRVQELMCGVLLLF